MQTLCVSIRYRAPHSRTAQRFSPVREVAPPVGAYDDPRTALELLKKSSSSKKKSPFCSTAARFSPEYRGTSVPGPGSYDVFDHGVARDCFKKAYLDRTKGGFGSSSQRCIVFSTRSTGPSPGQYQAERRSEEPYKKQNTAAFKSATERLVLPLQATVRTTSL
ncbi:hypothetical protein NL108_016908 [Boleophthalmus pectinirostris]|nr:hypothetical protein NL108_016908 [Boleophthalmus pectinirostris]